MSELAVEGTAGTDAVVEAAQTVPATTEILPVDDNYTGINIGVTILAGIALIAALYLAHAFFVPLLIGILVSYALRPLVDWLKRRHVPRFIARDGHPRLGARPARQTPLTRSVGLREPTRTPGSARAWSVQQSFRHAVRIARDRPQIRARHGIGFGDVLLPVLDDTQRNAIPRGEIFGREAQRAATSSSVIGRASGSAMAAA